MSQKKTSYYDILQIPPSASDEEVKRAYRRLAMQFHPDRNPQNRRVAELRFRLVNEAYAALKDSNNRLRYNQAIRKHVKGRAVNDNGPSGWERVGRYLRYLLWPVAEERK